MEYAHDNANGVLACLDEDGWWSGKFICFGSSCANDSATFELEPGPVIMNNALRSDLSSSADIANIVPLGLGLCIGLGIPLLAALVGCLYFWTRLRQRWKPSYQSNAGERVVDAFPRSAFMFPSSGIAPTSEAHSFEPMNLTTLPNQGIGVPELGDTSTLGSQKFTRMVDRGLEGRHATQMG